MSDCSLFLRSALVHRWPSSVVVAGLYTVMIMLAYYLRYMYLSENLERSQDLDQNNRSALDLITASIIKVYGNHITRHDNTSMVRVASPRGAFPRRRFYAIGVMLNRVNIFGVSNCQVSNHKHYSPPSLLLQPVRSQPYNPRRRLRLNNNNGVINLPDSCRYF